MDSADSSKHHDIVAAAIVKDRAILLCHRHPDRRWYPNVWDLPGGHIDEGESPIDALVRELREELNAEPTEHDAIKWFTVSDLDGLELADPDVAVACRRAVALFGESRAT